MLGVGGGGRGEDSGRGWFEVKQLECRVQDTGFNVWGSGLRGCGLRVSVGFRVQRSRFGVQGCGVVGFGFGVQGLGVKSVPTTSRAQQTPRTSRIRPRYCGWRA